MYSFHAWPSLYVVFSTRLMSWISSIVSPSSFTNIFMGTPLDRNCNKPWILAGQILPLSFAKQKSYHSSPKICWFSWYSNSQLSWWILHYVKSLTTNPQWYLNAVICFATNAIKFLLTLIPILFFIFPLNWCLSIFLPPGGCLTTKYEKCFPPNINSSAIFNSSKFRSPTLSLMQL